MNLLLESLAFVDIETSGLRRDRHSILSIGAISLAHPKNVFYGECQKEYSKRIDQQALLVNGFKEDEITSSEKPALSDLIKDFTDWAINQENIFVLGGHNTWFDAGFLEDAAETYEAGWRFGHRYVDLHSAFYARLISDKVDIPPVGFGLDTILRAVGLQPRPSGQPHNALQDAKLEAEAFYRIACRDILLSDYSNLPLPEKFVVA